MSEEKRLLKKYEHACGLLYDALCFYADPDTYHAIAVFPDSPCGDFWRDFGSEHHNPEYNRPMAGKRARRALRKVIKQYGDLVFTARFPGGNWELSRPHPSETSNERQSG